MSNDSPRPQLIASVIVRRLEAATVREELTGDPVSTWTALADIASGVELGSRCRFELRRIAELSEIYLRLFLPPEPCQLSELTSDGELVWTSDQANFGDVLVTTGYDAAVFSRDARSRSARSLNNGVDRVRVVKLTAPLTSLLRTSRFGPPDLLVESDLWFGPHQVDPAVVVAAAAGGVS